MPTPFTVSTYGGIANSNMGFCLLEACQNRRKDSTEDKKSGSPTAMYRHSEAQIQCRLFSKNSHKNS
jgi:hypothetical protein